MTIVAAAAAFAFLAPLAWAFPEPGLTLRPILWLIGALFVADLAYELRRASRAARGGSSLRGYLTSWFAVDVVAALYLPVAVAGFGAVGGFLGLAKLSEVGRALHRWRLGSLRHASPLPLVFAVFWLILAVHWICSGWIVLRGVDPSLTGLDIYIDSLYWTVTTLTAVGYGDITPESSGQKLFAIATMVVGLAFLGYMIGIIASMLSRKDPARMRFLENIERLSVAAQYGSIPAELQRRVYDYYAYVWRQRPGYEETDFLDSLPLGLKEEVSRHLKGDVLEKVELFRDADPDLVGQIALRLHPEVLTPGDFVFRQGDVGQSMYFVARGKLDVIRSGQEQPVATLVAGDFFGEIALFSSQVRTASVRAVSYCDVYALSKSDFERVFRRFPEAVAEIEAKALSRRKRDASDA